MENKKIKITDFDTIIIRLKRIFNLKFNKDLAELLGMPPSSFSDRVGNGSIPYEKIIELCAEKGLSLDSVFGNTSPFPEHSDDCIMRTIKKYNDGYDKFGNDEFAEPFYFDNCFCKDNESELFAVTCDNVHNYPIIDMGDIVIVKKGVQSIEDTKIYFLKYKGRYTVAKIFKTVEDDHIILKFESPIFYDITASLQDIEMIGRVVFIQSIV